MVNTVDMSARVTAIDTARRKMTLLGPDGDKVTVKVGPEAVNFDQLRVGDLVNATVTEELVVYLDEEGASPPDGSAAMVALAPKGAQPGGLAAETTQVTAVVTAIDATRRMATLAFDDGSTKTFPVRDDIDLSQRKVGEKVVFLITEMIALSVEKP
jgi:Cu/Ag efflux protein CusF